MISELACKTLEKWGIPHGEDFYLLSEFQVRGLLIEADVQNYRRPAGASDWLQRFHASLQAAAAA